AKGGDQPDVPAVCGGVEEAEGAILDELCALTGWTRRHARLTLETARSPASPRPVPGSAMRCMDWSKAAIEVRSSIGAWASALPGMIRPATQRGTAHGNEYTASGSPGRAPQVGSQH